MIIKAFDISNVLGTRGTLTHRQHGAMATRYVYSSFRSAGTSSAVEIDFSGIYTFDVAFIDEFIPELMLIFIERNRHSLFISNLDDELFFAVECVLARRELICNQRFTVLRKQGDNFSLCGSRLEPNLSDAADIILHNKKVTTRFVADKLSIPINNASTRMKRLFDLRLVDRFVEPESFGRQHYYILPRS